MGKLLNSKKLRVESPKRITINNLEIGGEKPKSGDFRNATVYFKAKELIVKGATTNNLKCYNIFEQNNGTVLKKVVFENCTFDSPLVGHNVLSTYSFEDGATITFKNCHFVLGTICNPVRLSNYTDAKNILITFDSCDWEYTGSMSGNEGYLALILLQKTTTTPAVAGNWQVVVKDCECHGNKITPATFATYKELTTAYQEASSVVAEQNAILYYYDDAKGLYDCENAEQKAFFPEVKIIAGGANKVFKA